MLNVELDHILPESDAYSRIREIIDHVEQEKEVYVITKEGRPVVAIINVDQLETTPEVKESSQPLPLSSLFGAPAAAEAITPTPLPTPPPVATPAVEMPPFSVPSAPPPLPPLPTPPAPVLPTQPLPDLTTPFQGTFPTTQPLPVAGSGSPLEEPLPPLSGTEHLLPPAPQP